MSAPVSVPVPGPVPASAADVAPVERSRYRYGTGFWVAAVWLVAVVGGAAFAWFLPIADPEALDVMVAEQGPSWEHWFGTDSVGRDVFSRTVHGARTSLVVGIVAVVIGMILGGALGLLAGYARGVVDGGVSYLFDTLLAFPSIVFVVLITSLTSRSMFVITVTLGVLAVAPLGRLARASTMSFASQPFVTAARALGAGHLRIMLREIAPNVAVPLVSFALLACGIVIVAEGSLAFLGLSVEQQISWGKIIVDGSNGRTLRTAPHVALFPIGVLFVTVLSLNLVGSKLQQRLDNRVSRL